MPDGVSHWMLTRNLPLPYGVAAGSLFYNFSNDSALAVSVGVSVAAGVYVSARWLSPDIDINGRTFNERGWSGRLIQILTIPYSWLPHRGLTHTPFLGTLLICSPILAFLYWLHTLGYMPLECIAGFYFGELIADLTHISADYDKTLKQQIQNRDRYTED